MNLKKTNKGILFVGTGQAACGIADLVTLAISRSANVSIAEAAKRVFMFDIDGLLVTDWQGAGLSADEEHGPNNKYQYGKPHLRATRDLADAIEQIKPTALIGATGVANIFTPSALRKMAEYNERPLIFALSNPTSKAECTAEQAYVNTDGRCLFSSGSPFSPVQYNGRTYYPGQGNNSYIFPGVALATIVAAARRIDEEVFLIAAEVNKKTTTTKILSDIYMVEFVVLLLKSLSKQVDQSDLESGRLYPPQKQIRDVSVKIASDVIRYYYKNNLATLYPEPKDVDTYLRHQLYDTTYSSYVPSTWNWPDEHMKPRSLEQVSFDLFSFAIYFI